jgi:hypothetical protein
MPRKNVATSYTGVNGKFRPGNPGRPKGARHRTTLAIEAILDGEAEALTRKAIELAKAGDTTALRLCLERLAPPRKDRPLKLTMPPLERPEDAMTATAGRISLPVRMPAVPRRQALGAALTIGEPTLNLALDPGDPQAAEAHAQGKLPGRLETANLNQRVRNPLDQLGRGDQGRQCHTHSF